MNEFEHPSAIKIIGACILFMFIIGGVCEFSSMFISSMMGGGAYGVGGLLAWVGIAVCGYSYYSTGDLGRAALIALGIGVALGILTSTVGTTAWFLRYGG